MEKFKIILDSIDWMFAGVILIGGRYWGSKYFRLSKRDSLNFLGFATAFAVIYLAIIYFTAGISKNQVANLFITYLVTTSFYELIAQRVFEWIEGLLGKKKETPLKVAVQKYEDATGETVATEDKPVSYAQIIKDSSAQEQVAYLKNNITGAGNTPEWGTDLEAYIFTSEEALNEAIEILKTETGRVSFIGQNPPIR